MSEHTHNDEKRARLAKLEAAFEQAGGRGVELADEIDALRAELAGHGGITGENEYEDEFPDEHSHHPKFRNDDGVFGADVFACDDEGRHYHLQMRITDEGVLFDVWDRYGEECQATFARTFDELVDFVFANDPMLALERKLLFQPEPLLRNFQVGNLYEFQAEDENHAIEQYRDAMADAEPTEVNYVHEIPREEPPEPVVTRCPLCHEEHRADWTCAKAAAAGGN